MSAAQLRASTQPLHDRVDAAFGGFMLGQRAGYGRFLRAHALALPAIEAALSLFPGLPHWRDRTNLLAADLRDLAEAMPVPLDFALADGGDAWGALYVIEGSRLGGAMLARGVAAGLPVRYLSSAHLPGEWRALRHALDAAALQGGSTWLAAAERGAAAAFALYERAATQV